MTIVDTWGRTLKLDRTDQGLVWKLPGKEPSKSCELSYHISYQTDASGQKMPFTLTSATDLKGNVTKYEYYDPNASVYIGRMKYASEKKVGNVTGDEYLPYLLLKSITYPNGAAT